MLRLCLLYLLSTLFLWSVQAGNRKTLKSKKTFTVVDNKKTTLPPKEQHKFVDGSKEQIRMYKPGYLNGHYLPTQDQKVAKQAASFVVSCMDFRLTDDIGQFLQIKGYHNNYDHFVLAGGSLGLTQHKYHHWKHSLIDHMDIGYELHDFQEIIFVDHLDCGAYKMFYPDIKDHEDEIKYHKKHMIQAKETLAELYPELKFHGYLMDLDGVVTEYQFHPVEEYLMYSESEHQSNTPDQPITTKKSTYKNKRRYRSRKGDKSEGKEAESEL